MSNPSRVASPFGRRHTPGRPGLIAATFAPWILLFILFTVLPAIAIFPISFTDLNGFPGIPVKWIGLENFSTFFSPARWVDTGAVLVRTVVFCAVVSFGVVTLGLLLAVLLNRGLKGSDLWRALIFLPTILGVTVNGLIWTMVLNPTDGPVAKVLGIFGIHSALLGDSTISFGLVIFIQIWVSVGYAVVIFIAGLQAIPAELYEAAEVDGAGPWRRFVDVTFPLLAPSVSVNTLLAVIGSLQSYQLIYVLTSGRFNTSVLASVVFETGFGTSSNQGYAASVSVIQFFVILVVMLAIYAPLKRRENRLES